jgi:hypothetical protein
MDFLIAFEWSFQLSEMPNADALQRPADNCITRKLSMKDTLIPVRCKRLLCVGR